MSDNSNSHQTLGKHSDGHNKGGPSRKQTTTHTKQKTGETSRSRRRSARRVIREVTRPGPGLVHPALIPGIGVERTGHVFKTNQLVFAVAGLLIVAVIIWAFQAPENIMVVGDAAHEWVTSHFGWMFGLLAVVILIYMLIIGYSRTGGVRLGADDEKPEFSTISWIAMLFSAGMGIGLLFFGPYEPLVYYSEPPHGFGVAGHSPEAMKAAMAQTMLHWGPIAWSFYALVGAAIAYSAYRRGRPPLISVIFEPLFGSRVTGLLGSIIDIFAVLVTLFGTTISLGMGALQIVQGLETVTPLSNLGNLFLITIMVALTVLFILSAVSGVERGIRALSNLNMLIAGCICLFVFITGPTLFLLNLIPAALFDFFRELFTMLVRSPEDSPETADFLADWTTNYWAWWVTWMPFVGMFIAKISRGRTLREYVTVVIVVPSLVCFLWFAVFGGTSMYMNMQGANLSASDSPESLLFNMLSNLPWASVTTVLAMTSIIVFFVTSADSASIVMSSMTQRGKPEPSAKITIVWGTLLGMTAISLLLAGGNNAENALSGLQSIMVVSALPFSLIIIGIMVAWARELRTDPYMLRSKYAQAAIDQGVRLGIADFGDDFVFGSSKVAENEGAGAWLDSEDPELTEWYTEAADEVEIVDADDVRRTLSPGHIQPKGPPRPDKTASGDESLTTRVHPRPDSRKKDN